MCHCEGSLLQHPILLAKPKPVSQRTSLKNAGIVSNREKLPKGMFKHVQSLGNSAFAHFIQGWAWEASRKTQASITSLLGFLSCRACHFWTGSYVDSWFTWKPSLSSSRRQWFAWRDHWQREERWADQSLLQEWGGLSPHQQRAEDPERCGWRIQWFIQRGWCPAALSSGRFVWSTETPWQLEHSRMKVEKQWCL